MRESANEIKWFIKREVDVLCYIGKVEQCQSGLCGEAVGSPEKERVSER